MQPMAPLLTASPARCCVTCDACKLPAPLSRHAARRQQQNWLSVVITTAISAPPSPWRTPPLLMLLSTLWDTPSTRADHVVAWRLAKKELEGLPRTRAWRQVRGPVGAAWLHLDRIHAAWTKPFCINLLDNDIDLLEVPPKMVARALKEHARRHYDRVLIASWAADFAWDVPAVVHEYAKGIDWELMRQVLRGKRGGLTRLEAKAYLVLATGAFWPEEKRWRAGGMLPTGTCLACHLDIGSVWHKGNECGAVEQQLTWMRIHGRKVRSARDEPGLMPLATLGIPPLLTDSRPKELSLREGDVPRASQGLLFGDASGVGRACQSPEVVTWALATLKADGESLGHKVCGTCVGWYPSVAKGELQALAEAREVACIPAVYAGDCQYVIDGFSGGVPRSLASSSSPHADLWRRVRWLLRDHGEGITAVKVKAHRSRARAELEDAGVGLELWHGNQHADATAKGLALRLWDGIRPQAEMAAARSEDFVASIARAAICTRVAQMQLDSMKLPRITKRRKANTAALGHCGDHQLAPRASGGGHWCTKCRLITRTASSLKSLAAKPCKGEVLLGVHNSHQLRWSLGITWCERCGYYMSRLPRALRQPCGGAPKSAAARNVLRRLRSGLPPTTAASLCRTAAENDWAAGCEVIWETKVAIPRDRAQQTEVDDNAREKRTRHPRGDADNGGGPETSAHNNLADGSRGKSNGRLILHRDERGMRAQGSHRQPPLLLRALPPRREDVPSGVPVPRPRGDQGRDRLGGEEVPQVCDPPAAPRPLDAPSGVFDCGRVSPRGLISVPADGQSAADSSPAPSASFHSAPCCSSSRPEPGASWTRRLVPAVSFVRRSCGVCRSWTASRCRTCRGPLCLNCARAFKACPAMQADRPHGEAGGDADADEGADALARSLSPRGSQRGDVARLHGPGQPSSTARPARAAVPVADGMQPATRSADQPRSESEEGFKSEARHTDGVFNRRRPRSAPPGIDATMPPAVPLAGDVIPRWQAGADHPSAASETHASIDGNPHPHRPPVGAVQADAPVSSHAVVPESTESSNLASALPCRVLTCSVAPASASAFAMSIRSTSIGRHVSLT